ncbi:MAG TPA: glycoside hydrolase family 3 N-terminal domain-containing protein [Thermoanaerobaculia bacterium]|nr:glycoside hydrolase family 3 N-terminal domain-containing protein [Thermoanaerobaculia bacterium]
MKRTASAIALVLLATVAHAQAGDRVEELLSAMTLEEKLGQLTQYVGGQPELDAALKKGLVGSILNLGGAASTNEMQRQALAGSRLKIPLLVANDVIHGYRTIFPIPLAIAATFDPALAELAARTAAREARASGIHWTFAPMVDIARDPRWGRIAEGAGEDPFLGAAMAAAYVRGFQGRKLSDPDAVMACAKHFAAYGAAEGGRDYSAADMSERVLREVYLPPFRAAVQANVATLMSAFNTVNGVPATANRYLLDDVLRKEWKFRGFVVSDYAAVAELVNHRIAATPHEAAIAALTAGVDMDMQDLSYGTLAEAVKKGTLQESAVDTAVRRVLRAKIDAGLFENPFTDETRAASVILSREHREAARRVAQRSFVLLKNENVLPLKKNEGTIAVIGSLAESKEDILGPWSSEGKAEEATPILDALRAAAKGAKIVYARGTGIADAKEDEFAAAVALAKDADVILAVLGESREMSGEAASRSSLELPGRQQQLLEALVATGKPVALLLLSGRPLTIAWAAEHVPAIVQAWFPGTEGAHALADVLFGDANFSGKLPVTIPRTTGQVPIYHAELPSGRPANVENRWTNKYADLPLGPLYAFGHGLSYTKFEYSGLKLSAPAMTAAGTLTASVSVRNTGARAGEEIVQLYMSDLVASVSRPVRELKGFHRIALAAGETKRVDFPITREQLEFWGEQGWVVEPGTFRVRVGPSSASGLEVTFEVR